MFFCFCLQEHGREKKKSKRKCGAEESETSEEIQVLSDGEAAAYDVKPAWFIPQENVKKCFELQKFSEASFRNSFGFIMVSSPFLILHGGAQWWPPHRNSCGQRWSWPFLRASFGGLVMTCSCIWNNTPFWVNDCLTDNWCKVGGLN